MTPRQLARATWEKDCTACFDRAEMNCLLYGAVISTPSLYVMALFHPLDTPDSALTNILRHHRHMTKTLPLCHVWLAAGNIGDLLDLLKQAPQITHISFQKRGYDIHRIPLKRLKHYGKRTTSTEASTATDH